MKRLNLLMSVLFVSLLFVGCSKDDNNGGDNGGDVKLTLFGKTYSFSDDDGATYSVKNKQLDDRFSNDNMDDLINIQLRVLGLDVDNFSSTKIEKLQLNKEYKRSDLFASLSLSIYESEKYNLEGFTFYLDDNSTVIIVENEPSKNYIKLKFANMVFNGKDNTGKIVETFNIEGDLVLPITYERMEKY